MPSSKRPIQNEFNDILEIFFCLIYRYSQVHNEEFHFGHFFTLIIFLLVCYGFQLCVCVYRCVFVMIFLFFLFLNSGLFVYFIVLFSKKWDKEGMELDEWGGGGIWEEKEREKSWSEYNIWKQLFSIKSIYFTIFCIRVWVGWDVCGLHHMEVRVLCVSWFSPSIIRF